MSQLHEARYVFLDVETIPFPDRGVREQLRPPKTHKKPDAIEAWRDAQEASGGLTTHLGEICTIAAAVNGCEIETWVRGPNPPAGSSPLHQFADWLAPHIAPQTVIVVHNWQFDGAQLEMMLIRQGRYGLRNRMADAFNASPYKGRTRDVYDTMLEFPATGRNSYVSLALACAALGIVPPSGEGCDVADQWASGDVDAILDHNVDDVRADRELFSALTGIVFNGMSAYQTDTGQWAKQEG